LARAAGIRYCVLFCDAEETQCKKWNEQRREKCEATYDDTICLRSQIEEVAGILLCLNYVHVKMVF